MTSSKWHRVNTSVQVMNARKLRAGVGSPPDGMPLQVWREAGFAGLYYLGRDASGEYRFTLDPDLSALLRQLFPDDYKGLA